MENNNLTSETIRYHYDMLRDDVGKIVDKLNGNLGFYAFRYEEKIKTTEIVYDTPDNLLSSVGIILSKLFMNNKIGFYVRKITRLPSEMKRPSKRVKIADCGSRETPKTFTLQVSQAINNAFPSIFTIDMAEVVEKTMPKIQVDIKGQSYSISGGTGFKGRIIFEDVVYRDLTSRRKAKGKTVTLILPVDEEYESDNENVLDGIERFCKELIPYKETRVEIAERVLYPRNQAKIGMKELIKQEKESKRKKREEG